MEALPRVLALLDQEVAFSFYQNVCVAECDMLAVLDGLIVTPPRAPFAICLSIRCPCVEVLQYKDFFGSLADRLIVAFLTEHRASRAIFSYGHPCKT